VRFTRMTTDTWGSLLNIRHVRDLRVTCLKQTNRRDQWRKRSGKGFHTYFIRSEIIQIL